ncbi:hypothetical protein PSPO01_13898 [Paraphaeosphaeria sporulosa]
MGSKHPRCRKDGNETEAQQVENKVMSKNADEGCKVMQWNVDVENVDSFGDPCSPIKEVRISALAYKSEHSGLPQGAGDK